VQPEEVLKMQLALPRHNLTVPFVMLILGATGGAAATTALNDDDVIRLPASNPATVQSTSSGDVSPPIDPAQHPSRLGARTGSVSGQLVEPGFKSRAGGPATSGSSIQGQGSGDNSFGARP